MQIQAPLQSIQNKTDRVFFQAFTELRLDSILGICLQSVKVLTFLVLIPVNMLTLNVQYGSLIECFMINTFASVLGLLYSTLLISCVFTNVPVYLSLAEQSHHLVQQEKAQDITSIHNCVSSSVFVAETNIAEQDLDQQSRKFNISSTKKTILTLIRSQFSWSVTIENFYQLLSFASLLYSIVNLVKGQMAKVDTVLLSLYVVVTALSVIPLVIACIFIVLSPIICIGLLIFCCCCSKKEENSNQFIDLPSKEATQDEIMKSGGDCSICFMGMSVGSKVYVLPCSQMHMFHCRCLKQWAKVKNTCPICRAQIPMTEADRLSQIGDSDRQTAEIQ